LKAEFTAVISLGLTMTFAIFDSSHAPASRPDIAKAPTHSVTAKNDGQKAKSTLPFDLAYLG